MWEPPSPQFSSPKDDRHMPTFEVTFRTSPIDDATEDTLLDEMDAFIATHGTVTLVTAAAEAKCGTDAATILVKNLRSHGVTVHRVEKDLVNAATIASRCGESRTAVMHYIQGNRRTDAPFPASEVSGSPSLWRWPDVNDWLREVGKPCDDDIAYLTRDEELQVDYKLCVFGRAVAQNFTAVVTPTVATSATPQDEAVGVAMKYVQ